MTARTFPGCRGFTQRGESGGRSFDESTVELVGAVVVLAGDAIAMGCTELTQRNSPKRGCHPKATRLQFGYWASTGAALLAAIETAKDQGRGKGRHKSRDRRWGRLGRVTGAGEKLSLLWGPRAGQLSDFIHLLVRSSG